MKIKNDIPIIRMSFSGGLEGIRTLDFYNANVALSQLSYEPLCSADAPITQIVYYY